MLAKRSNPGAAVRPSGLLAPRMLWPLDCFVARAPRNDGWVAADPIDSVVIGRRLSRIHSAVNPLLIRCYGGRVSPVRAEFIAGSRRGERGFATISLPCGFCSRRGGRRSAMPSQFENPMMISLFENNNVCHDCFSHSERLRMLIRGGWRVAEWRMGTPDGLFAIRYWKGRRDETRGRRRRPRPIGRDARLPLVERARA